MAFLQYSRRGDLSSQPTPEGAAALGMRLRSVYQGKSSVTQMLQQEVRKLEEGTNPRDPG